jgi:hypothetical protein
MFVVQVRIGAARGFIVHWFLEGASNTPRAAPRGDADSIQSVVRMKRLAIFTLLGCTAFLAVFLTRARVIGVGAAIPTPPPSDAPDSVQLAALGIRSGVQLVVYVLGGLRCGYCELPETKLAFASLRQRLSTRYVDSGEYSSVRVIGVGMNNEIADGLRYLESVGTASFSEISVGSGWQNEHVVRLVGRERLADLAVPLAVVVARPIVATLSPLRITYGADSVLRVVQGAKRISEWVRGGAGLSDAAADASSLTLPGAASVGARATVHDSSDRSRRR